MTLPVREVTLPSDLKGEQNGKLSPHLLSPINGGQLHHAAAASWRLMRAAAMKDGVLLAPISTVDTYRPYEVQVRIFQQRYDRTPRNTDMKVWQGVRYWLIVGNAPAASPGTSNHGWGLAVDCDLRHRGALTWLLTNATRFGWSWEAQSEPWHIRYVLGDKPLAEKPVTFTRELQRGDSGRDVMWVQRRLNAHGARLIVDGKFGANTAAAVVAFRRRFLSLRPARPVVTRRVWNALER